MSLGLLVLSVIVVCVGAMVVFALALGALCGSNDDALDRVREDDDRERY